MSYKVNIIGRLGTDAETVTTGNTSFISCRVAVDDSIGKEKNTRWVSVSADANRFKNVAQYLTKGKLVHIIGGERITPYISKNGEPSYDTRVWVDSIEFVPVGQKQENSEESFAKEEKNNQLTTGELKTKKTTKVQEVKKQEVSDDNDDELPF